MFRSLIIITALVIIYLLAKRLFKKENRPNRKNTSTDNMVQCLSCGTFVPENKAIIDEDGVFCCELHQYDWRSRQ
ncbi:PP0621 family protein [Pseudomonadota bacterium]